MRKTKRGFIDDEGNEWVDDEEFTKEVAEMIKNMKFTDLIKDDEVSADVRALMEKVQTTKPQVIRCPHCNSDQAWKYGIEHGQQVYICQNCHHKFNAGGAPYRMRVPTEQIGAAIAMFYDGLSLSRVAGQLEQSFGTRINPSSVYRWVIRFSQDAVTQLGSLCPKVSDTWQVDETVIDLRGYRTKRGAENTIWLWHVIDEETRFLIASHMSETRTIADVVKVMLAARDKTDKAPKAIISDKLRAYTDGIERVFGADTRHLQSEGFSSPLQTQLVERFNGTVKDRTRILRGFKTKETAEILTQGFFIHYNFFRPHMSLNGQTLAQAAGIETKCRSWTDVIKGSCVWVFQTRS